MTATEPAASHSGTIDATDDVPAQVAASHRRAEVWIAAGCRYPAGAVWWLYAAGTWPGGFVRSINRAVARDPDRRVPITGAERV